MKRAGIIILRIIIGFVLFATMFIAILSFLASRGIIGDEWNPLAPLRVDAPITTFTKLKLTRTAGDTQLCFKALEEGGILFERREDFVEQNNESCGIKGRLLLTSIQNAKIKPLETSCAIALRTAMWVVHDVQPLGEAHFGERLAELEQIGSYNCRRIRTASGNASRMSTHATANSIDITGFVLANGERIALVSDWDQTRYQQFLRDAHEASCNWFRGVLGPEYNSLHADHFHLEMGRWNFCR